MKKNNIYKVVNILNSETIIINAGKNYNIKEDDSFNILGKEVNIVDPDTKEKLGKIQNIKETVTVTKVFDKMCECSHFTNGAFTNIASNLASMYGTYKKQLDVDPSEITLIDEEEKTIKVGDVAILNNKNTQINSTKTSSNKKNKKRK